MFSSRTSRFIPFILNCTKVSCYSPRRSVAEGFKSAYSIDKIYPKANVDFTTVCKPPESSSSEFSGHIPVDKLEITYSRSSGAGGQNVNKVNTKVEIRFHLESADWIPKDIRSLLIEKYNTRLTKEGILSIKSEKTRSQMLNLADCLDKLRFLIRNSAKPLISPTLEAIERKKSQIERSSRERLREKRLKSAIKEGRQSPIIVDE